MRNILFFGLFLSTPAFAVRAIDRVSDGLVVGQPLLSLDVSYVGDDRFPLMLENNLILVFQEKSACTVLGSALSVDMAAANISLGTTYAALNPLDFGPVGPAQATVVPSGLSGTIAAGTSVQCGTLYFQGPVDINNPGYSISQWGTLRFYQDILGVEYTPSGLDASDSVCSGASDLNGPSARTSDEGWDLGAGYLTDDAVRFVSLREMQVQAQTNGVWDTMRVIVPCK